MEPLGDVIESINLTGNPDPETENPKDASKGVAERGVSAAHDVDRRDSIADATTIKPHLSNPEGSEYSTEPASFEQRTLWGLPIEGNLKGMDTGGSYSLHLIVSPMDGDGKNMTRMAHSLLKRSTATVPALEEDVCHHSVPNPSDLAPSTGPIGSGRISVGRVVLPPENYNTATGCRIMLLPLRIARQCLEIRAREIARNGLCGLFDMDVSRFIGNTVPLPEGLDYDCADDCELAERWLDLATLVIKCRADALCRGDSVPPIGNTNVDLEQEQPQETAPMEKKRKWTQ